MALYVPPCKCAKTRVGLGEEEGGGGVSEDATEGFLVLSLFSYSIEPGTQPLSLYVCLLEYL